MDWRDTVRSKRLRAQRDKLQRYANSLGLDVLIMVEDYSDKLKVTEAIDFGVDLYRSSEVSEVRAFLEGYGRGKEDALDRIRSRV